MTDTLNPSGPETMALGAGPALDPRGVITGVTNHKGGQSGHGSIPRYESAPGGGAPAFDWYASTVTGTPLDDVLVGLADNLGADVREGKALHGYSMGFELVTPEGVAARVLAGGKNGAPHAWASGADAERYVDVVRSLWPDEHRVSRMDSRIDFGGTGDGEEVWRALYGVCVELAQDAGLKTSVAGDYLGGQDGRTLYVGSKRSNVFVRLYEKGKQLRRGMRDEVEARKVPGDWVRLEIQVRPQGDARWEAAGASPSEAWGYSGWTRALAGEVAGLDVPQVTMQVKRETEDERALAWMARQYGPMLTRLAEEDGWGPVCDRLMIAVAKAQRDG